MKRVIGLFVAGIVLAWSDAASVHAHTQAARAASASPSPVPLRAVLDQYCVTCHNGRLKIAGLTLDDVDPSDAGRNPQVWEKVVRKMRAGVMPPLGRPRPDSQTYAAVVTALESDLDRAAASHPNPGRTDALHRLNRNEYQNAIRDLLGIDVDVASQLPADDSTYGFDNIASALKMSPTLMERYLVVARKISRTAIGLPARSAAVETYRISPDASQERHVEGLPLGTRGGALIRHTFPEDGEYVIQAKLALDTQDNVPRYNEPHQLEIAVDGIRLGVFTLPGEADTDEIKRKANDDFKQAGFRRDVDAEWRVRVPIKAGARDVSVTFPENSEAELDETRAGAFRPLRLALKQPFERRYVGGYFNEETRSGPYLGSVTISGPFNVSGPGDSPSRQRIFVCRPSRPSDERRCASTILSNLATRAFRRTVTSDELADLLAFFDKGREDGFDAGIELALRRILVTPAFLFRIERDPGGVQPAEAYPLTDVELASRLSFFLWSSIPDGELLDLARRGTLTKPGVLERQTRRMLQDPRSEALVSNFTGQWLYLRNLPAVTPDQRLFPDFDDTLRQAFRRETELFFDSILRENRSALELLSANYTFVNERLARHYGIPHIKGSQFRRVILTDENRRGLLGQGSILATTSYANRTSPVVRGKWILDNLLGAPPPSPPPNVPSLKETNAEGKVLSMRERMVQHRANPACASCHATMDPAGFALENFDALGRWRTRSEASTLIDASGALPDGTTFDGVKGLREALLNRPELFATTLTEKLLTYALGRGIEYSDSPAIRSIVREAARNDYRLSSLILGIVQSRSFQMRVAGSAPPAPARAAAERRLGR